MGKNKLNDVSDVEWKEMKKFVDKPLSIPMSNVHIPDYHVGDLIAERLPDDDEVSVKLSRNDNVADLRGNIKGSDKKLEDKKDGDVADLKGNMLNLTESHNKRAGGAFMIGGRVVKN